jgi:osmoprotectant transport system substrate-binding protein
MDNRIRRIKSPALTLEKPMHNIRRHTKRMKLFNKSAIVATGAASLLVLSGCAAGSESAISGELSGVSVTVGSKDFDEQLVLGYMLVEAFEAAGADVTDRVNLGGTSVAREALVSGAIDTYMEYNGTGWVTHLGNSDPSFDSQELTEGVRAQDLEENGIHWLGRSPFNNTYGFTSSPDATEANGGEPYSLQTMMEYVVATPDAIVCMESEYPNRDDGLVLMEEATGLEIPEAQRLILDTGIIYTETADNNCDFGEVFTTDGRIGALGLTLVEDPGVNILYNVSVNLRDEVYSQAPEAFDSIVEGILAPLDNERMAALNGRVSVDGEDPQAVARDFLVQEGLIAE